MKTYNIFYMLLAWMVIGCSTSDDGQDNGDNGKETGEDADYTVLVSNGGVISGILLNASIDVLTLDPDDSPFGSTAKPQHTYRDGTQFSFYKEKPDCVGEITKYDFNGDTSIALAVFSDLNNCELSVKAVAHSENSFFLAYKVPTDTKDEHFFVRAMDMDSDDSDFTDIELDQEPVQMTYANNRLFILGFNEDDGKNALLVLDTDDNELIHEINLDLDVQKISKNSDGNILVSYENLHLEISSSTMGILSTTRYEEGKEPKFGFTESEYFDIVGNLYYPRPTEPSDEYPTIPAVYDFDSNTATLYFYENFLSTEQRKFEYEIGDTSLVSYDAKNNLILVGYRKSGSTNLGGLLRIKPAPDPKFIDNIDLDGVPYAISIK